MRVEIPDCTRCCLCMPLRHGILIFGYLNLGFTLFVLVLELFIFKYGAAVENTMFLLRGVGMYADVWIMYLFYGLELVFNVVLLVGAHKKDVRLIRSYYYYGLITNVAMFLTFIVVRRYNQFGGWYFDPFDFALAFSGLALQSYLLLLIRSELTKTRYQTDQFRYVNHMSEVFLDQSAPGDGRNPL